MLTMHRPITLASAVCCLAGLALAITFARQSPQQQAENLPIEIVPTTGHITDVQSVAFSPNGRTVVTGGSDHSVRVWNAATGRLLRTLVGFVHSYSVVLLGFAPDGRTLAT